MPQRPPDTKPEILRGDLSEALLELYPKSPDLAVDTETMGLQTLRDRLCVVQLCDRAGRAALVQITRDTLDPSKPPGTRAPRLKRLFEDPRVTKVFHFARFDVAALRYWLGIEVAPLYCTRTVSKLVRTYTDRHGLKDNLLELLDVEMDKAARHTDWSSDDPEPGAGPLRDLRRDPALAPEGQARRDAATRGPRGARARVLPRHPDLRPARPAGLRQPVRALSARRGPERRLG